MAGNKRKRTDKRSAKKIKTVVKEAVVHVKATFSNTTVTITDLQGNTLSWSSAGQVGYKNARQSTPLAGKDAARQAALNAKPFGIEKVTVSFNGPGPCREYVVKALTNPEINFSIVALRDDTPIPHNGCRPPKKRRV